MRRLSFAALALLCSFAACSDEGDYSKSRLIDRVCNDGKCVTEGSARQVQGLTADSVGFEIGPGPGSVVFPLSSALVPEFSSYAVDVLIQGEGSFSTATLTPNYAWVRVDTPSMNSRPDSATVVLGSGSHATIADLRLVDTSFDDYNCSVGAPGRRRHGKRAR